MKSNNNSCGVHRSKGKQYTIFVPDSNKNIKGIVRELDEHFDCILTTPKRSDEPDQNLCEGTEIAVIRTSSDRNQDLVDIDKILGIVSPRNRRSRPILYNVRDDITVYGRCNLTN
jgi:hypothetical protein